MSDPADIVIAGPDERQAARNALAALIRRSRPPWMRHAACVDQPLDLFFCNGRSTRQALEVCGRCPVRVECLRYANDNDIRHGVWGGQDPGARRAARRAAAARARAGQE